MMDFTEDIIDPINKLELNISKCKVTLFFCLNPNKQTECLVLDNLLLAFDRRMEKLSKD